jgi:hypothetical protein
VRPPHKEVIVDDDAEQILEAINDRGITRLLVEDKPLTSSVFLRETLSTPATGLSVRLRFLLPGVLQR